MNTNSFTDTVNAAAAVNWTMWGTLGTLGCLLIAIITLLVVLFQTRAAIRQLKDQKDLLDQQTKLSAIAASDLMQKSLADLNKMLTDPANPAGPTSEDAAVFRFNHFYTLQLLRDAGVLPGEKWNAELKYIQETIAMPGMAERWVEIRHMYAPTLQKTLDPLVLTQTAALRAMLSIPEKRQWWVERRNEFPARYQRLIEELFSSAKTAPDAGTPTDTQAAPKSAS